MKKTLLIILPIIVLGAGIVLLSKSKNTTEVENSENTLKSVSTITHGHGLALTAENKLYIPTITDLIEVFIIF